MLQFERDVVATLVNDEAQRPGVENFVDGALRAMPEYLRAGVAVESVALGAWARLRGSDRPGSAALHDQLAAWETSRIGLVRQYVRMLRSLVLFAESELAQAAG